MILLQRGKRWPTRLGPRKPIASLVPPVQLIARDPETMLGSLLVVVSALTLPQQVMSGRSWGTCALSEFPARSGIPTWLCKRAMFRAMSEQLVEVRTEKRSGEIHLYIYPTRAGVDLANSRLGALI